jgi:hypothetical protein
VPIDLGEQPKSISLPTVGKPIPCDDVTSALPGFDGPSCARVAMRRVAFHHDGREGAESWRVRGLCFDAMRAWFAGSVVDVHGL